MYSELDNIECYSYPQTIYSLQKPYPYFVRPLF